MKIALVCSHGGHLTEMQLLSDVYKDSDHFFVTYDSVRTRDLEPRKYLIKNIGTNPIRLVISLLQFLHFFFKEKPDAVISTGSEIAIPAFIVSKLMGIKTLFIESWCRVRTPSGTGKIVYFFSDLFLVQWPDLLRHYGRKALYYGGIVE